MTRPDLRPPRAEAAQLRADWHFTLAVWAWAFAVFLCIAVAIAPTVIAKAQHDAAAAARWQDAHL